MRRGLTTTGLIILDSRPCRAHLQPAVRLRAVLNEDGQEAGVWFCRRCRGEEATRVRVREAGGSLQAVGGCTVRI